MGWGFLLGIKIRLVFKKSSFLMIPGQYCEKNIKSVDGLYEECKARGCT